MSGRFAHARQSEGKRENHQIVFYRAFHEDATRDSIFASQNFNGASKALRRFPPETEGLPPIGNSGGKAVYSLEAEHGFPQRRKVICGSDRIERGMTNKPKIIENFISAIRGITPSQIAGTSDPGDIACAQKQLRAVLSLLENQKEQATVRHDLISRKQPAKRPLRRPFRDR